VARFVCVHGHFYQPPRENPWLESVELQDEAYPFHDWNERITAECYRPNVAARILDGQGRITRLVNNYGWMSFNIGPTLLAWMEDAAPDVYRGILEADTRSAARFGGHGSAMAQVYNHLIMPLASRREKRTQIAWGIADFRYRFGRDPEGMWLAETAVDDETLDLLAEHGIRFTVLSPYQARRTRRMGASAWTDATHGRVDPTMPYQVTLPSGRTIIVFFYDGPTSRAVAFEGLLEDGERFSERLLAGFRDRPGPQLVHIATDGESYGHHHRHGEMALAAAMHRLARRDDVTVTNYAQYLDFHPPTHEAEVTQDSSWSCAHGVERWRADCGCSTGGGDGWNQRWRAPLRHALDHLKTHLDDRYEKLAGAHLTDPWAARDDYIAVVLDRSQSSVAAYLDRWARRTLDAAAANEVLRLLELQRQSMLMFTSCGWFFEELSRIEPLQVLRYAARALQLLREVSGEDLEPAFLERLAAASSNHPELGDGRDIYLDRIAPHITEPEALGAHFAIAGLFTVFGHRERLGCFEVDRSDYRVEEAGRAKLATGRATIRSTVTWSEWDFEVGVLHFGDHNVACGVRGAGPDEAYDAMRDELETHFAKADFPEVIRALDDHFGDHGYSLRSLFRDEQQRIVDQILTDALDDVDATHRGIYRTRAPLMRFLNDLPVAIPVALRSSAEVVINAELRDAFLRTTIDPYHIRSLVDEARRFDIALDDGLALTLAGTIERLAERIWQLGSDDRVYLTFGDDQARFFARVEAVVAVASTLPFEVELAPAQNVLFRILRDRYPRLADAASGGDGAAARWVDAIERVATQLNMVVPDGV
jgi:alpha-amylase/alpha-mannosidase (GH57 family)